MDTPSFNRREFLKKTSALGAGLTVLPGGLRAGPDAPSNQLNICLIGSGWYGMVDLKAAFKVGGVHCLAICDVDSEHLTSSAEKVLELQGSSPKTFKDYRDLLEVPDLQAVIIATPPHWHALPFLAALDKKLDIYCEKPVAYDIREGQVMVEAAKKQKESIIQIGFQRRMSQAFREARDFIQQGNIGRIIQVDVQIHYPAKLKDPTPQPPPASLDWDAWCGPAPKLPYSPQIGHFSWRLEKEYGNGHLVDWGIHYIDMVRWILNENMPKSVQAFGGIYHLKNKITTPDSLTANFEFETCPVTWRHRLWGAKEFTPEISNGILFYGEAGTVFANDRRWTFIPNKDGAEAQEHEARSDAGTAILADFLNAVKSRKKPLIIPEDGFFSTATVQLGMIAYETGHALSWDAESGQISDNPAGADLLKREYRTPWKHPYTAS